VCPLPPWRPTRATQEKEQGFLAPRARPVALETAAAAATKSQVAVDPVIAVDPVVADDHAVITIDAVDAGVGAHLEQPSTPKPKPSPSLVVSCIEHMVFLFAKN